MTAPAGWYPDPRDPSAQRYWDGADWTEHTTPATTPAVPQAPAAPQAPAPYPQTPAYAAAVAPVHRRFSFGESIRRGFARWTNYRDRATPGEYWWFYLFSLILMAIAYLLFLAATAFMAATGETSTAVRQVGDQVIRTADLHATGAGIAAVVVAVIVLLVVAVILFFPQLALAIRRLHDTDRSGWWYLIGFVPFVGGIILLVFLLLPGTPGPNRWGPPVTE